MTVTDTQIKP